MKSPNQIAIEALPRYTHTVRYGMDETPDGEYFMRSEVLAALTPPAQGSIDADGLPPLAYVVYAISNGKHRVHSVKSNKDRDADWAIDDCGLGEYWSGNEALILADRAARQSAAPAVQGSVDIERWSKRYAEWKDSPGMSDQEKRTRCMLDEIQQLRAALAQRAAVAEVADELGDLPSDDYHMPFMCLIENYMSACDYHGSQTGERCTIAEEAIRAALTELRGAAIPTASTPPAPVQSAAPGEALDFSKPLETEHGKPVAWVCEDVIQVDCARVCVDQASGVVYSSPCRGLKIRNVAAPAPSEPVPQGVPDDLRYAQDLATAIWQKHYAGDAPHWALLPDFYGVLTQIDNMTAGLSRAAPTATSGGEAVAAALTPLSQLMRLDLSDMHTKLVERMDYWMCRALSSEAASEPFGYVLQNDARADSWSLFKGGTKEQADRMRQVYPKVHMVYLAPPSLPATDAASAIQLCRDLIKLWSRVDEISDDAYDAEGARIEAAIRALISKETT